MATTLCDTTDACDRCERTVMPAPLLALGGARQHHVARLVPAYWGDRLCPDCCQAVASAHDLLGDWPPLPDADAGG